MKTTTTLLFLPIILLIVFNANAQIDTTFQSAQKTTFATIDVLIVFYTNTAGGELKSNEINQLKNGIELAKIFYWRNSKCRLNLNTSFLEIHDYKKRDFFPPDGLLTPEYVENDFRNNGITENEYGIILLIYNPPNSGENKGGMQILGQSGYAFITLPLRSDIRFPGESPNTNFLISWPFAYELQHTIFSIGYDKNIRSKMWQLDKPMDFAQRSGEYYSYMAETLRNFEDYLKIKAPWGKIEEAIDADGDKFPDHDSRVPMDEFRFQSDTTKTDSDDDGLDDLAEFIAGIYRSTDPRNNDSDLDLIPDNEDVYPLHRIHQKIPKITPSFHDEWQTWYPLCSNLDFSTSHFFAASPLKQKTYMNWDDDNIYLGCELNAPAEFHVDIDFLNDGWWHGKDNYRLVVDPFSDRFAEIRVMDATREARDYKKLLNKTDEAMWDDELAYISKFGKIVDETSVELMTNAYENKYLIRVKIPKNDRIPIEFKKDKKIGLRIYFTSSDMGFADSWATMFEQYEFFEVILN